MIWTFIVLNLQLRYASIQVQVYYSVVMQMSDNTSETGMVCNKVRVESFLQDAMILELWLEFSYFLRKIDKGNGGEVTEIPKFLSEKDCNCELFPVL